MSEASDAVVVIVSEETGIISVAVGGMLKRGLTPETLQKLLQAELQSIMDESEEDGLLTQIRTWITDRKAAREGADHEEAEDETK